VLETVQALLELAGQLAKGAALDRAQRRTVRLGDRAAEGHDIFGRRGVGRRQVSGERFVRQRFIGRTGGGHGFIRQPL
jgi:hypothetical protein